VLTLGRRGSTVGNDVDETDPDRKHEADTDADREDLEVRRRPDGDPGHERGCREMSSRDGFAPRGVKSVGTGMVIVRYGARGATVAATPRNDESV
jgi:hypothetical protein